MEQFKVISTEFYDAISDDSISELEREVNEFVEQTPQIRKVEWLQTTTGSRSIRLTAVIAYTITRAARGMMD